MRKKIRNNIIALVILLCGVGVTCLYFHFRNKPQPQIICQENIKTVEPTNTNAAASQIDKAAKEIADLEVEAKNNTLDKETKRILDSIIEIKKNKLLVLKSENNLLQYTATLRQAIEKMNDKINLSSNDDYDLKQELLSQRSTKLTQLKELEVNIAKLEERKQLEKEVKEIQTQITKQPTDEILKSKRIDKINKINGLNETIIKINNKINLIKDIAKINEELKEESLNDTLKEHLTKIKEFKQKQLDAS